MPSHLLKPNPSLSTQDAQTHTSTQTARNRSLSAAVHHTHGDTQTHARAQTLIPVKRAESCEVMSIQLRYVITLEWFRCLVNGIAGCNRQEVGGWATLGAALLGILN